ncbi:MAG: CAP domain-containing protein [Myxococcales bacterium]|nr:CAP domain-containing protein [Myxococcales bacterium]
MHTLRASLTSTTLTAVALLMPWSAPGCGDLDDSSAGSGVCPETTEPLPSCEDNGGCPGGETGALVGITEAHNRVRAAVEVPAGGVPLPELQWSDDLAAVAARWAEHLAERGCGLRHSSDCRYGENLAWFGGFEASPSQVVEEGWASEKLCYRYGAFLQGDECSADCNASGGCGHYTQMVWRDSREVGCAVTRCSDNSEVWVCNYAPVGNIVGQVPY